MSIRTLACLVFLLLARPVFAQPQQPHMGALIDSVNTAFRQGRVADATSHIESALALAPRHIILLDALVRMKGRGQDTAGVIAALERITTLGGGARPVLRDTIFTFLRGNPRFQELAARLEKTFEPRIRSDTMLVAKGEDGLGEGIFADERDPAGLTFYAGGGGGRVLRIRGQSPNMVVSTLVETEGAKFGMKVDSRRRLWANVSIQPPAGDTVQRPRSELQVIDMGSGAVVRRYRPPAGSRQNLFNDLALHSNGDAYVTDSDARSIYLARGGVAGESAEVEVFFANDPMFSLPNGIAISPDERRLYAAHFEGITVWDLATRRHRLLEAADDGQLVAIDGLYACQDALVAVQTLPGLDRVVHFELDSTGARVTRTTVLDQGPTQLQRLSTGAPAGEWFYFHSNREGPAAEASERQSVLHRVRLPRACR